MGRDQERFYDGENQAENQPETSEQEQQPSEEEIDDRTFFLKALANLRAALQAGWQVPMSGKRVVNVEMCLRMIDDLEVNLPDAIQMSMQMLSEQERIRHDSEEAAMNCISSAEMRAASALDKAKKSAEQIMANAENDARMIRQNAQDKADHMVDESEIVRRAKDEARNILNDARVSAQELRLKAAHDAEELLSDVEARLSESLKSVRRRRADLGDMGE